MPSSSVVEQVAVNHLVIGSTPILAVLIFESSSGGMADAADFVEYTQSVN